MRCRAKRKRAAEEKNTKLRSPNFIISRTRLSVRNIPPDYTEGQLRRLFISAVKERATKENPRIVTVRLTSGNCANTLLTLSDPVCIPICATRFCIPKPVNTLETVPHAGPETRTPTAPNALQAKILREEGKYDASGARKSKVRHGCSPAPVSSFTRTPAGCGSHSAKGRS